LCLFLLVGSNIHAKSSTTDKSIKVQKIVTDDYEFYKSENRQSAFLILFPDIGGNAESIRQSFDILDLSKKAELSLLLMNFNNRLFLSQKDKTFLTQTFQQLIDDHKLSPQKVVIGGFSSGGIVSSLWSHYLLQQNHPHKPEKVFAVDSPFDLVELFKNVTDVDSTSHEISLAEAEYITNYFKEALNAEDSLLQRIAEVSPFDYSTKNFENIEELKQIDFRIYTEPDSVWWKESRGFDFEETDSYQLIRFAELAKEKGWNHLNLITTTNKGYRLNGQRHPHSWSIVDKAELINWITTE
jgi:hypothetical protein